MSLLAQQQQHELDSLVLTRIVHRHCLMCLTQSLTSGRGDGDCWPAASMVLVASRGRRWCWWLAGVVSCGTATSVVWVASRGRRWCWWLAGSSVVVPGVGGVGGWPSSSGLSAAVWAVVTQPAVVSGSSAHPARSAKVVMV